MNWLAVMESMSRISVEHILNAIPAGFVIAFFAWALLRLLRGQNSGTRFAVWFVALLSVVAFPMLSGFGKYSLLGAAGSHTSFSVAPFTFSQSWAYYVFAIWAIGAAAGLFRLAAGVWRIHELRRRCTVLKAENFPPTVRQTMDTIISSSRRPITIASSEDVRVPAALGLWKRTIVLPAWTMQELPPADLTAILLHEFAHLRRGDDWTNLIQKIVRALFFFHPAVWWIDGRLSTEREMACDDVVLAETGNPLGYATCLVSLLEKSLAQRGWSMAQAAVSRAREASLRLAQILSKSRPTATRVWTPAVGMVGLFSLVCLAAMPHAPQLIAFDRARVVAASAQQDEYAQQYSDAVRTASPQAEAGNLANAVPVRMNVPVDSRLEHIGHRAAKPSRTPPVKNSEFALLARRMNSEPPLAQMVEASAADQAIAPQYQTLIFIETTQWVNSGRLNSDGPVVMQVWSVVWIRGSANMTGSAPLANSI
jgi:beta-lactamase regulating signal transducer with metallopeptidase domain